MSVEVAAAQTANLGNLVNTALTNANNRQLAREQNEWNERMYHENNAYNSPAAQAERLAGLGLSRSAIAQSVSNMQSTQPQSADLATDVAPPSMIKPDVVGNAANNIALARTAMDMAKLAEETRALSIENKYKDDMLLTEMDAKRASTQQVRQTTQQSAESFPYTLRGIQYANNKMLADTRVQWQYHENMKMEQSLLRQRFAYLDKWNENDIKRQESELLNLTEERKNLIQQRDNLVKQGKNTEADTLLKSSQRNLVDNESYQKHLESVLTKFGMPQSEAAKAAIMVAAGELTPQDISSVQHNIKGYLNTGKEVFLSDPNTRAYYRNIYDEGYRVDQDRGLHSAGGVTGMLDDFLGRILVR